MKKASDAAPANIVAQLPANARLFIDGQLDTRTSPTRAIVTPELQGDREYFYTLRAELVRDGKTLTAAKRVPLLAGALVSVDFGDLTREPVVSAGAPSNVTVRLPADARMTVNGARLPLSSAVRTFATPHLAAGQQYFYTIQAEVDRDGQIVSKSRRVVVEANKAIEVDFSDLTQAVTASR